jgi:ATP-dependent Clp protease protease subunit
MAYSVADELMAARKIILLGDLNQETQEKLSTAIIYLNTISSDPIIFYIDSRGGGVHSAIHLWDTIRLSKAPLHGIVVGKALSAAFAVLQACHVRLAFPNANLMNHGSSVSVRIDDPEFDRIFTLFKNFDNKILDTLTERGKASKKDNEKWSRMERYFTAMEAFEMGWIDSIATTL